MLRDQRFNEVFNIIAKQPHIINSMRGFRNHTLLMWAARNRRKDCVVFLLNQPHDVSVVDDGGSNVLHRIVVRNDDDEAIEMFKCLDISQLNNNIINKQNIIKKTPLHYAAWRNNHKSIRWLLNHGADPSIKDLLGLLPDEDDRCDDETKSIIRSYRKW